MQKRDCFESIAQRLEKDSGFGSAIAAYNGHAVNDIPEIGEVLKIPQYLPTGNNAIVDTVAAIVGFVFMGGPIGAAVLTGLADAAYQEVAIELGWQEHFSLFATITAGIFFCYVFYLFF